ncbi:MAG: DUF3047 domain-containing protein [Candidatus Tectimicrobiota bacterium]
MQRSDTGQGRGGICGPVAPQRPSIQCYTHRDVGILHTDVSVPLTPDTLLRWAWKVDVLPSPSREDQLHTHDSEYCCRIREWAGPELLLERGAAP